MVFQRIGNALVLKPGIAELIKANRCPVCALPKFKWNRRKDWRCCSKKCTKYYYANLVIACSWVELRQRVFERDDYVCKNCGKKFSADNLIADHIEPIAIGGNEFDLNNIQTLCRKCNKIKTRKDMKNIAHFRRTHCTNEEKRAMLMDAIKEGEMK
jgi:5-methylcytosine-specific restriction endonuclease McrA